MAFRRLAKRAVRPTVLVVGEGLAEKVFLLHIRDLYTGKQEGYRLVVRNARGKEAGNVVDHALKFGAWAHYDSVAALLDTDAGWTPAVRKRAQRGRVELLLSDPCLEAWLLRVLGQGQEGNTKAQKDRFRQHFGGDAHDTDVIARRLTRPVLDKAREHVEVLDQLLKLIGC